MLRSALPPGRLRLVAWGALALVAATLVACGSSESADADDAGDGAGDGAGGRAAAPVVAERELERTGGWLNGEPTTIAAELAAGRVVLVDFWTYTCVNCVRTIPFLREWHERYGEHGLTILGVHTPEFDFEHELENVRDAVGRLGVSWRVVQDNDYATWRAFDNRFWPAKYLIGADGRVRYEHFGEGQYDATEQAIRAALEEAGHDLSGVPAGSELATPRPAADASGQTRELYGGYQRNYTTRGLYAAQDDYYNGPDLEQWYEDVTPDLRQDGRWYLHGLWRNEREAIVHARATERPDDYIALRFRARSVNVVLTGEGPEPYEVYVELDGSPLTAGESGADVVFDEQGRSLVVVREPRMYLLLELPAWGSHELRLSSNSDRLAIFAFTFGSYTDGP